MTQPGTGGAPLPTALLDALERARDRGFLGPGPVARHVVHAQGFARAIRKALGDAKTPAGTPPPPFRLIDVGSGGGVPGLVVAVMEPDWDLVLLDANARRCELLTEAVRHVGLTGRVQVVQERAEVVGRDPAYRGTFDLATARSFGPPAVTAECAAPLLRVEGLLVTSEPPAPGGPAARATSGGTGQQVVFPETEVARGSTGTRTERWPLHGLAELGMAPLPPQQDEFAYQVVRQVAPCPVRFPRRVGVPNKRPLF